MVLGAVDPASTARWTTLSQWICPVKINVVVLEPRAENNGWMARKKSLIPVKKILTH
jgi:hypothetical protein